VKLMNSLDMYSPPLSSCSSLIFASSWFSAVALNSLKACLALSLQGHGSSEGRRIIKEGDPVAETFWVLSTINHIMPAAWSAFQLPCFKFVLLPFLRSCTDCRWLRYAGNDAPKRLSAKPSLHVTIPGVVVVGVEFVKKRN